MSKHFLKEYLFEYSKKNKINEDYPVYSVTNSNGFCTEYFNKDVSSQDKRSYKLVPYGYFAYNPSRINVGSIDCQRKEKAVIVSPLYNVFGTTKDIDSEYLLYFFKSNYGKHLINSNTSGSVRSNLKLETLFNFKINIESLERQKQKVYVLNKICKFIKLEEKKLSLLDELIKSRFVEMFENKGFETQKLESLCVSKAEYGAGSASVPYADGRPRYVRITDINDDGTLNDDYVCSINEQDDLDYKLSYGDFMFARMGATVGKTYMFMSGNEIYAGYLIRYKLDLNKINPRFLFAFTKTNEYWLWVKNNQSGAAQPGINAKKYNILEIPVPPIELQNEFAAFVEQVDKSKFVVQKRIELYKELLNKKMDEYFN